jgi:hypothetical protein
MPSSSFTRPPWLKISIEQYETGKMGPKVFHMDTEGFKDAIALVFKEDHCEVCRCGGDKECPDCSGYGEVEDPDDMLSYWLANRRTGMASTEDVFETLDKKLKKEVERLTFGYNPIEAHSFNNRLDPKFSGVVVVIPLEKENPIVSVRHYRDGKIQGGKWSGPRTEILEAITNTEWWWYPDDLKYNLGSVGKKRKRECERPDGLVYKCGVCGEVGHNRRKCPHKNKKQCQ